MSLENLLRICPHGVTSKNFMGEATSFLKSLSCIFEDAFMADYNDSLYLARLKSQ